MNLILIQTLLLVFHPIFMSLILILASFLIRRLALYINISWFFYLLVLVFLGGVIILIIYISTLATNEKFFVFNLKNKQFIGLVTISLLNIIGLVAFSSFNKVPQSNFMPNILYEAINFNSILFLMLYLLLTMICIVKLVKFETGPLIMRLYN